MMGARIKYQLTVAYDAATKDEPKPIAFHKSAFAYPFELQSRREGLRLYRDHGNGVWKVIEEDDDDECGFAIFDDPPIPVKVGNAGKFNQEFLTLQPGENWTHEGCGQDPFRAFHPDEGLMSAISSNISGREPASIGGIGARRRITGIPRSSYLAGSTETWWSRRITTTD
jgi:hypothetical protein